MSIIDFNTQNKQTKNKNAKERTKKRKKSILLVELVPAEYQTEPPYSKHFHLSWDISFGFLQKETHQAASMLFVYYQHRQCALGLRN